MEIKQQFITGNKYYTNPTIISPTTLILHSVACPQPDPYVFAKLWNTASYPAHYVVGTEDILQCLPNNYKSPHVGAANAYSLGIEMTEPKCIAYSNGQVASCSDKEAAIAHCKATYENCVELFAFLCELLQISPENILSHSEAHAKGIGTNHADPEHLWKYLKLDFTMDTFRTEVKAKFEGEDEMERWKTIDDVPSGYKAMVQKYIDAGALKGKADGEIDLTEDMIRCMEIMRRYVEAQK